MFDCIDSWSLLYSLLYALNNFILKLCDAGGVSLCRVSYYDNDRATYLLHTQVMFIL